MTRIGNKIMTAALALALGSAVALPAQAARNVFPIRPPGGYQPLPWSCAPFGVTVSSKVRKGGAVYVTVTGDCLANDVGIIQDDVNDLLEVLVDGAVAWSGKSSKVKVISVDLKQGEDAFFYGLAEGTSDFKFKKTLRVELGSGDDAAWFEFRGGGIGGNAVLTAKLDLEVRGSAGKDDVVAHFGRKQGSRLDFVAKLGDGPDTLFMGQWGDVTRGAEVVFDLRGEGGDDAIGVWNTYDNQEAAYGKIDIASGAAMAIKIDGGPGSDTIGPAHAGKVNGKLEVALAGGDDDDDIDADVTAMPGSGGQVIASLDCGLGTDTWDFDVVNLGTASVQGPTLTGCEP